MPPRRSGLWDASARLVRSGLKPNERMRITRAGLSYLGVLAALVASGLHQQANLILLVAGMAVGPMVASWFVSAAMLRKLRIRRRAADYLFSGEPLRIGYTLENGRRSTSALALGVEDQLTPIDRGIPGAAAVLPRVVFGRVGPRDRARLRWQGPTPARGRYRFGGMELVTRSPFGLLERRQSVQGPAEIILYPRVGRLTRRWRQIHRESSHPKPGQRPDRSSQTQDYHGLRDYRPGDSPRWIHWRTTARIGKPMVKEFEQQNEQDLALLIDPWLPRTKVTSEQREAVEAVIRFAATVCLETCRSSGRRLLLGWTGATPAVRQGPASVKLLHELMTQLAVLRPSPEGQVAALLDALPPAALREGLMVLVSTRPVNLAEEFERSARARGGARGPAGRVVVLDAARGDLNGLIQFGDRQSGIVERRKEAAG